MELRLIGGLILQLEQLYRDMEAAYDTVAGQLDHSCDGCPDNCCDSYFLHHTYIEWAYLWHGVEALPDARRRQILERAARYQEDSSLLIGNGRRPKLMCPLNDDGRCTMYKHRLMVCRTHGVPASMIRPDGKKLSFPGCFRCQELVESRGLAAAEFPVMERTGLLRRLVILEHEFLEGRRHLAPKVRRTIASMLVEGPPRLAHCSDPRPEG
ncbi:MAG: hypothetical protein LJE64_00020 [Desulfofustis sp.]|jgi:hypothetical protein|nr:hypothetical protein [Desulfofustis sp.]